MNYKGIIMAGGSGSRLRPLTLGVSKQLLPVYDKPLIYYPLSILMLAGIQDILIITTPEDRAAFTRLLGDGHQIGINLTYAVQDRPNGIAEAFILGKKFIGSSNVCLVLGDNIFWGHDIKNKLKKALAIESGATVFGYSVKDPSRFGVVEFDKNKKVVSIEEKPDLPKSPFAITGLYFYDNKVVDYASRLKPSERGELEITSINQIYLESKALNVELLGRGYAWLDTGTHDSLHQASNFIQAVECRQGFKIACIEEIAYSNGWIDREGLRSCAEKYSKTDYGRYLSDMYFFSYEKEDRD